MLNWDVRKTCDASVGWIALSWEYFWVSPTLMIVMIMIISMVVMMIMMIYDGDDDDEDKDEQ